MADILVRLPVGIEPSTGDRLAASLAKELRKEVRTVASLPEETSNENASPAEANAALARARSGFRALDIERTVDALDEVWAVCVVPGQENSCRSLLFEASILRGALDLARGEEFEAARWFRTAHAISKEAIVDPKVFSPKVVSAFARACSVSFSPPPRAVILRSFPEGAAFTVDGEPVDVSSALSLSDARHVVGARLAGYEPVAQTVEVHQGNQPLVVEVNLLPREDSLAFLELRRLVSARTVSLAGPGTKRLFERFGIEAVLLVDGTTGLAPAAAVVPGRDLVSALPDVDLESPSVSKQFADAVRLALNLPLPKTEALGPPPPDADDSNDDEDYSNSDELDDEEDQTLLFAPVDDATGRSTSSAARDVLRSPWLWIGLGAVIAVVGGAAIGIAATD